MNNDELIAAGHELAKCLDNEPLLARRGKKFRNI